MKILQQKSEILWCVFDLEGKNEKISSLEKEASSQSFWSDSRDAKKKMSKLASLNKEVDEWVGIESVAKSLSELVDIALDDDDFSLYDDFSQEVLDLTEKLNQLEFNLMLSGEFDRRNSILAIHSGAGGVESRDWAQMLMRMYLRWSERRGYQTDILDISQGDEAGIKSATLQISGDYSYGYLKAELGVHRLVRLSPFDSDHARHTSFALIEVLPEAEQGVDVAIDPKDIKIDTFRASGAGGQSVQKNSTAVRITHIPTGIKVSCQNERSQYQNKTIAMKILTSRLLEQEMQERAKQTASLKGKHVVPEWGNQIRSYVLHPYKMVKDHRTNFELSDADSVLDGNIDSYITAYLKSTLGGFEDTNK